MHVLSHFYSSHDSAVCDFPFINPVLPRRRPLRNFRIRIYRVTKNPSLPAGLWTPSALGKSMTSLAGKNLKSVQFGCMTVSWSHARMDYFY